MRFLANGPDIPSDLVAAQERGHVIFVCGAGVSMSLNLPNFRGLVLKIYELLGEDPTLHLAENEAIRENGLLAGQYDRVLRLLEKRLAASNVGRAQGMRERVRETVRRALAPPLNPDLSNHRALFELSRDTEGTLRLVTTNFDTLFERAWPGEFGTCPSFAGAAMPQPKTAGFAGVLHLHGRLADADLNLDETDLVLTSAEFGDAYLRSGWASRYVYDLARAYTVVLVGYSADDPPMRYLLEVLEADRERYPDLQRVYAFAGCDGASEALESALWRAKGVEPIMHRLHEGTYSPLYESVREWARYASNATVWRREQLAPLLAMSPSELQPEQVDRAVELLSHGDASEQLKELGPAAPWLSVFQERGVLKRETITPGPWISSKVDDPAMISACAGLHAFDDRTRWLVERAVDQHADLVPHRRKAWELLLRAKKMRPDHDLDMSWFRLAPRIQRGEAGYGARRTVASMFRPRLSVQKPWSWGETDEAREESLETLVWLDYKTSGHTQPSEVLQVWPTDIALTKALFTTLNQTLHDVLDEASDVGFTEGYDRADRDVPSIAPHQQKVHHNGFYPLTRLIADLWLRLADLEPEFALATARSWLAATATLTRRLAIFAASQTVVPSQEAADWIHGLGDHDFWVGGGQVEIMKALVGRWDDLPVESRHRMEGRIVAGLPRTLFADSEIDDEKWTSIEDSATYRRLTRLRDAGKALSAAAVTRLAEIQERHPRWKPGPGDRDDFHSWSESSSGPSGQPDLLTNVADDRLVVEAMRIQRERFWDQGDLWRVFCQADPEKALRGLIAHTGAGAWDPEAWRPLIWTVTEGGEPEILGQVVDRIIAMPDEHLRDLHDTVAALVQRQRPALQADDLEGGPRYLALWDRLAGLVYDGAVDDRGEGENDLSNRALNPAGGILVWTLVEAVSALELEGQSGLPDDHKRRMTLAVNDRSASGQYARVQIMHNLAYLEHLDPTWAAENLIPRLAWSSDEAGVLWRANAYDRIGSSRLFNAVKNDLLIAAALPDLRHLEAEALAGRLFQVVLWHQNGDATEYNLEASELRRVLVVGSDEVRSTISWQLWRLMGHELPAAQRSQRWTTTVGPLFRAIWPLDAHIRNERLSENLMRMALNAGDAFADAVDAIVDLVVPFRLWEVAHSLRLEERHANIDREHPKPFLRLLNALVDPALHPPPGDLTAVLERCREADITVVQEASYRRLFGISQASGA
jgi:hypothetical protein